MLIVYHEQGKIWCLKFAEDLDTECLKDDGGNDWKTIFWKKIM